MCDHRQDRHTVRDLSLLLSPPIPLPLYIAMRMCSPPIWPQRPQAVPSHSCVTPPRGGRVWCAAAIHALVVVPPLPPGPSALIAPYLFSALPVPSPPLNTRADTMDRHRGGQVEVVKPGAASGEPPKLFSFGKRRFSVVEPARLRLIPRPPRPDACRCSCRHAAAAHRHSPPPQPTAAAHRRMDRRRHAHLGLNLSQRCTLTTVTGLWCPNRAAAPATRHPFSATRFPPPVTRSIGLPAPPASTIPPPPP